MPLEIKQEMFTELRQLFEQSKTQKEGTMLLIDTYLNFLQTREQSLSQDRIENFIEENFESLKQKHLQRQMSSKKKKRLHQKREAAKVLLITGNTGLIREFVLNELKEDHNLNIQRISLLQKRTPAYFKNSILEGTQSSVQAAGSASTNFISAFFQKKVPA